MIISDINIYYLFLFFNLAKIYTGTGSQAADAEEQWTDGTKYRANVFYFDLITKPNKEFLHQYHVNVLLDRS
jgi:hypothetical protein